MTNFDIPPEDIRIADLMMPGKMAEANIAFDKLISDSEELVGDKWWRAGVLMHRSIQGLADGTHAPGAGPVRRGDGRGGERARHRSGRGLHHRAAGLPDGQHRSPPRGRWPISARPYAWPERRRIPCIWVWPCNGWAAC